MYYAKQKHLLISWFNHRSSLLRHSSLEMKLIFRTHNWLLIWTLQIGAVQKPHDLERAEVDSPLFSGLRSLRVAEGRVETHRNLPTIITMTYIKYSFLKVTRFWISYKFLSRFLITKWIRGLRDKLTILVVIRKFAVFYGTQNFVVVFTITGHRTAISKPVKSNLRPHTLFDKDPF